LLRWQELFPTRATLVLAAFVCVIVPTVFGVRQIDANPKFSPIDEAAHFDYVERVSRGELPRLGERLTQTTLREMACRRTALPSFGLPPCDTAVLRYDQFSSSLQYETQHPPTYYAATAAMRWVVQKVGGVDNRLDATRLPGIVWLVVGLLLLWAAGRLMAIDPLPLASGLLLLATAPVVVYHTATVTNDVTAVPATGLVALAAALFHRGRLRHATIVLFAAGFLASAFKATNSFAAVAVAALLAVGAIAEHRPDGWRVALKSWSRTGGALLVGALLPVVIWAIVHRTRALIDPSDEPTLEVLRDTPRTLGLVIREAAELFRPLTGLAGGFLPLSPKTLDSNVQSPFYTSLGFLLIGAGLGGLFVTPRRWNHVLGLISVASLYLGGVAFGLSLMLTYDIDPGLSGRYALSLGPLLILVLAASVTGRWSQRALALFAGAYLVAMCVGMFS
jgi:hypothetical protein